MLGLLEIKLYSLFLFALNLVIRSHDSSRRFSKLTQVDLNNFLFFFLILSLNTRFIEN